jgi:hypothetical protein
MRSWFKDLSDLTLDKYGTSEEPVVISGFDAYHEELITFQNHSSLPSTFRGYSTYKGGVFSEKNDRWQPFHGYEPEAMQSILNLVIGFKNGNLYKHEAGPAYNTFYGAKQDSYIEPVFNILPMNMKPWMNIAITATDGWSVDRILSEYRGYSKTQQQSRIPLESFTPKEDTYFADIKNDLNSPNATDPIIRGNKMRSKAIQVLLKLDPSIVTLSLLHYVTIGQIDSPKNPITPK